MAMQQETFPTAPEHQLNRRSSVIREAYMSGAKFITGISTLSAEVSFKLDEYGDTVKLDALNPDARHVFGVLDQGYVLHAFPEDRGYVLMMALKIAAQTVTLENKIFDKNGKEKPDAGWMYNLPKEGTLVFSRKPKEVTP